MTKFGTDGLRGLAGEWPLVPEALVRLGAGLGKRSRGPVLMGRDTRSSGEWIQQALQSGVQAVGQDTIDLGVVPTPVVARCTARRQQGLGVVISASHNPARDNGIKVLRPNGTKATTALETFLEKSLNQDRACAKVGGNNFSETSDVEEDVDETLKRFNRLDLTGLRIAIGYSSWAATWIAPDLLTELGADVIQIGGSPTGENINKGCGSLHLKQLGQLTKRTRADMGFAFDGDADRCLAVNHRGELLDGDHLLAILASDAKRRRRAGADVLVGTVMTNGGLETWLKNKSIRLIRTPVGDKYVVARMKRSGAALGGENSGHLVIARDGLVGDGCRSMLSVLEALQRNDFDWDRALEQYTPWPQILINVPVTSKPKLMSRKKIQSGAKAAETRLQGQGRLLLRYSGTENLARVMVEGEDRTLVKQVAQELADIVRQDIG